MRDMRASSAEILAAMRWIVHGVTVVLGCLLLIALPAMSEGTGLPGPDAAWMHLVLWLTSLYALMWGSEGWLRMRGACQSPKPEVKLLLAHPRPVCAWRGCRRCATARSSRR